jgi:GTP-binding protein EngB required for normal cell division
MTSGPLTAEVLRDRVEALGRFVRAVERHVPAAALIDLRALVDQAGARLRLSPDHTVVALAGATGGGKSTLFNALVRMDLSPPGHLRPTTAEAHACVWGSAGAGVLLDWLGVPAEHRFTRESALDAEDEAALRGMVLLDLPDTDSVATAHRVEADRLVGLVDQVIWVLDPQKYADQLVHDGYLRHMWALREVTVVLLNQIDRLSPDDVARCRADLARLVEADGLPDIPVLVTSAKTGTGLDEVRALLEKVVGGRQAALVRLEGEIDAAVAAFGPMVGPDVAGDALSRDLVRQLGEDLAAASGVTSVSDEIGRRYARAAAVPGWLLGWRRGRADRVWADVPPPQPAAVAVAVRRMADQASAGLPAPWPEEAARAASASLDELPGQLSAALSVALRRRRRHWGWTLAKVTWWLACAALLVGAFWLGWYGVERARGSSAEVPSGLGIWVPVLLAGAGSLVLALLLLTRPLATIRTRRATVKAEHRLTDAVTSVARERVVAQVRVVLRDYGYARAAWVAAGPAQ